MHADAYQTRLVFEVREGVRDALLPMSRELGTHEPVKSRFRPWLLGKSLYNLAFCSIFARKWHVEPYQTRFVFDVEESVRDALLPVSSELGTHTPVKASFWPWLSGKSPCSLLRHSLYAQKWNAEVEHSLYTQVYSVIYDSVSVPRQAIFSPRETLPEFNQP